MSHDSLKNITQDDGAGPQDRLLTPPVPIPRQMSISEEVNADVGAFLKAASRSTDKFDLRDGFYSADSSNPSRRLDLEEVEDRHRSSNFPHVRHQYGLNVGSGSHGKHHHHKKKRSRRSQDVPEDTPTPGEAPTPDTDTHGEIATPDTDTPGSVFTPGDKPGEKPEKEQGSSTENGESVDAAVTNSKDDQVDSLKDPETPRSETKVRFNIEPLADEAQTINKDGVVDEPGPATEDVAVRLSHPASAPNIALKAPQKVQFCIGTDEDSEQDSPIKKRKASEDVTDHTLRVPHHHRRHHHDRIPSSQDLALRRHIGSEIKLSAMGRDISEEVRQEEGALADADIEEISSHRFADTKGLRKRKITKQSGVTSIVHIGKHDKMAKPSRKLQDHSPHEMFVELDELLVGEDQEWVWQEKARWIKFEEDIEEGAERWGKPHVASLSFHSLLELRKCIEQGVILLDLEATDLPSIANIVVDKLVIMEHMAVEQKGKVLKALLLKHKHVGERNFLRRNLSHLSLNIGDSSPELSSLERKKKKNRKMAGASLNSVSSPEILVHKAGHHDNDSTKKTVSFDVEKQPLDQVDSHPEVVISNGQRKSTTPLPSPSLRRVHTESHILKRIPDNSEATTVLVGSVDFLDKPVMAFVRLSEGQPLNNLTEVPIPVRFLFFLLGPDNNKLDYYEIGRSISTLMANTPFHDIAYRADDRQDLLDAINEFLDNSIVLPPGELDKNTLLPIMDMARKKTEKTKQQRQETEALIPDKYGDPLKRTKRPFGGLVNDVRRRYPKYLSDFKDALSLQCLATFFFIYFACLSPAITFGGLLSESTGQRIGVSEMLVVTCVGGIVMALLAGQPLVIVGFTGPILIFEQALFEICDTLDIDYLSFRVWIGFWVTIIGVIVVMLEGSFLVGFVTRFLEEIFSSLISLIFIYEVFNKLYQIFQAHPLVPYYPECPPNQTDFWLDDNLTMNGSTEMPRNSNVDEAGQPNTALLSLILTFGTFLIAYFLKYFRNSKILGRSVRRAIGDFGIPIAIVIMVLIDFLIKDTYTRTLDIPTSGISPTNPDIRGWFINPLGVEKPLPIGAMFAAVLPALLVAILLFMETLITSVIINKKERNLQKGSGYHLDILLISILASFSGILGLPMLCVATVRSVTHVSALSVFSRTHAPGEKPKLVQVLEQRVTGLAVHIMIGVSVLLGPVLRHVPLAVLFGVFLYMGIASMSGVQLFERVELFFVPVKHHPNVGFVRRVRTSKMHLFTFIQLVCLAVLWAVKSTQAALAFPFILILLIPVRLKLLGYIFTPDELLHLDRPDAGENYDEDEPDFYEQAHLHG